MSLQSAVDLYVEHVGCHSNRYPSLMVLILLVRGSNFKGSPCTPDMNPPVIWPLNFHLLMSSLLFHSTKLAITQHATAFSSHTNKSSPVDCLSVWMTQQQSKSAPCVRKCQSKQLNSLHRWPTVVWLLSTLHITQAQQICRSTMQGHHSQQVTISSIAAKDVQPW